MKDENLETLLADDAAQSSVDSTKACRDCTLTFTLKKKKRSESHINYLKPA